MMPKMEAILDWRRTPRVERPASTVQYFIAILQLASWSSCIVRTRDRQIRLAVHDRHD